MNTLLSFDQRRFSETGKQLYGFASELYPICRSITGDGIRRTLDLIGQKVPLQITHVPSGTAVFDWTIPKEWTVRDAYIKDATGRRVVDFRENNLHLLNYSTPIHAKVPLAELREHLFSLPEHPDWIPYRTSYYQPKWGFCVTENQKLALSETEYEVHIDTALEDGQLTYGECVLPGLSDEEVLVSVHACHPSLANDNLSGLSVATWLAQHLSGLKHRYSYRFLFIPGTIGAIAWLARNHESARQRVRHGLVLAGVGDAGGFHYKKSRRGDAEIDRAVMQALRHCGEPAEVLEFSPYGYDERQYCSPGFNLPVGCLMRSVWGTFAEYHTSADNLDFIHADQLVKTLELCTSIVDVLEHNGTYRNQNPCCEPQLGKRNLYRSTGGESIETEIHARLWVLNLSDGEHSLLDISERSGLPFRAIRKAADLLCASDLLHEVEARVGLSQEERK